MNPQTMAFWLAIAGIGSTLLAALVGPVVADFVRHRHATKELLLDRRIVIYGDLLVMCQRFYALAVWKSEHPTRPYPTGREDDANSFMKALGQGRVVGGKTVRASIAALVESTRAFTDGLAAVLKLAQADRNKDHSLPPLLRPLHARIEDLEKAIRDEIGH